MLGLQIASSLLLLFATPIWGQCGVANDAPDPENDRIVHGVEAKPGAWPWIVSLIENRQPMCGGSIIGDRWILTAAHCFTSPNARMWQVAVGDHELYTDRDDSNRHRAAFHDVERIIRHPRYQNTVTSYGDIALLKLRQPIRYNNRVQPICMPGRNDPDFTEYEPACYAAGWGEDFGTARNRNALQQVHSQLVNIDICNRIHRGSILLDSQLCFGDGRKGACMGDSGGPLMCKRRGSWVLAGATSWGNTKCRDQPGVFTKISHHRGWIEETMRNY